MGPQRQRLALAVSLTLLFALALSAAPAHAAWPRYPGVNLPVSTATGSQSAPEAAPDGSGGVIIVWQDGRDGSYNVYAHHVLPSGIVDPAWPVNGLLVSGAASDQYAMRIAADGSGGAYIAWLDTRVAVQDIYAHHVSGNGVLDPGVGWAANGRVVCTGAGARVDIAMIPDGTGGAILSWTDTRSGNNDIYAHHLIPTGVDGAWPANGRAVCTAVQAQYQSQLVTDGAGGAVIAWNDLRNGNQDIYAGHVLASGGVDVLWPANGVAVCTAANGQTLGGIARDGSGGAFIVWEDSRGADPDIYGTHVAAGGALDVAWTSQGYPVCFFASNQLTPVALYDGMGGVYVAWHDLRNGAGNFDVYAQHLQPSQALYPGWVANGVQIESATSNQYTPEIVSDGGNGALIAWIDNRNSYDDIYSSHILSSGPDPVWTTTGVAVSTAASHQDITALVTDGAGGFIAVWSDYRASLFSSDVYAQRVARFGAIGTPEAEIISVRDVPNDNGGKVKLSWYASYLDTDSDPNLNYYEIYRSVPPNSVTQASARGARVVSSFAEAPAADAKAFYVQPEGAQVYAWEYAGQQTALHFLPTYSFLAPTTDDSTASYNPKTIFMIVARDYGATRYWLSRPDSGYSADNLPPAAPAPFIGEFGAGQTHLHWDPNAELDLAGYRLYRGSSPGFVPGPGNLVSAQPDTGFVDAAGQPYYYKLSAVDIHGNESPFALLSPSGTTDVTDRGIPGDLFLARPGPNPARGTTTFRWGLPRAARVSLAVYDAGGRRVRLLAAGLLEAGERTAAWDLTDDHGNAVRSGLYFVKLEALGRTRTQKLAALR